MSTNKLYRPTRKGFWHNPVVSAGVIDSKGREIAFDSWVVQVGWELVPEGSTGYIVDDTTKEFEVTIQKLRAGRPYGASQPVRNTFHTLEAAQAHVTKEVTKRVLKVQKEATK